MDALKAEIAQKRKAVDTNTNGRPQKYMRKGDLERLKEEEERKAREEKEVKEREERQRKEREAEENRPDKVCTFTFHARIQPSSLTNGG